MYVEDVGGGGIRRLCHLRKNLTFWYIYVDLVSKRFRITCEGCRGEGGVANYFKIMSSTDGEEDGQNR